MDSVENNLKPYKGFSEVFHDKSHTTNKYCAEIEKGTTKIS